MSSFVPRFSLALVGALFPALLLSVPSALAASGSGLQPSVSISQQAGVPVSGDFMLGPTRFALEMNPGEQKTVTLELTNRDGKDMTYKLSVEDFAAGSSPQEPTKLYGNLPGPFPARDWITPVASSVTLKHGERAEIPVTVHASASADAGDHYAAVIVERQNPTPGDSGFSVLSRVGTLFLIQVNGDHVEKGDITGIQSGLKFYWSYPIDLSVSAQNQGTVHMEPQGTVQLRNIFGFVVDELPVRDWVILRNSSRTSALSWHPAFALGRYTAETHLSVFGHDAQAQSVTFWVLPALPVILTLVIIFVVSYIVQMFFSRFEIKKKQ